MANEKEPTLGTRGYRANEVRKALGITREAFAAQLARVAEAYGLREGGKWSPSRVSSLLLSKKPMTLDDAAAVLALAVERGLDNFDWNWLVYGEGRQPQRMVPPRERPTGKLIPRPKPSRDAGRGGAAGGR
jgi:hypothetical protein